jgi:hypothetical protein
MQHFNKRERDAAVAQYKTNLSDYISGAVGVVELPPMGQIKVGLTRKSFTLGFQIYQQIVGLAKLFIAPLVAIVPALLYIKMRHLSGESLSAALTQIEEGDAQRGNSACATV